MQVFLVGGAVRDQLLNLSVKERDWVVVGATPEIMLERGFTPVGKDFPVFLHPETKEEYALARTERKVGAGYHGFEFHADAQVSLEEDLQRRDLTINAMASDSRQNLIDPWGGAQDLQQKILRHVSPAFVEDPVRVLRLARFAAKFHSMGFVVAQETVELMRAMSASGEISALVVERVWKELKAALDEPTPSAFFELLHKVDALPIIFPELAELFQHKGLAQQAMNTLDSARNQGSDAIVIFAVLVTWCTLQHAESQKIKDAICDRFKVSKAYRQLVYGMSQMNTLLWQDITPNSLLRFFEKSGVLRQADIFTSAMAVIRLLPATSDKDEPDMNNKIQLLQTAEQALLSLDLKSVVGECQRTEDIESAVRTTRLTALKQLLSKTA